MTTRNIASVARQVAAAALAAAVAYTTGAGELTDPGRWWRGALAAAAAAAVHAVVTILDPGDARIGVGSS